MFILPMMAILFSIEFFLVFERTTKSYQANLTQSYTMLVVTQKPMALSDFQTYNNHIKSVEQMKRETIVNQVVEGITPTTRDAILQALPYFYNVGMDAYLDTSELEKIKQSLEKKSEIKRVETFVGSYQASYRLFSFIKFIFNLFILFMSIVSLFLISKQMEVWKYAHKERMQVMEIFGAPMMLRSGVLFKVALWDALFSTLLVCLLFFYMKFSLASKSGIEVLIQNRDNIFHTEDIMMLLGASVMIIVISVYTVAFSSKGVEE